MSVVYYTYTKQISWFDWAKTQPWFTSEIEATFPKIGVSSNSYLQFLGNLNYNWISPFETRLTDVPTVKPLEYSWKDPFLALSNIDIDSTETEIISTAIYYSYFPPMYPINPDNHNLSASPSVNSYELNSNVLTKIRVNGQVTNYFSVIFDKTTQSIKMSFAIGTNYRVVKGDSATTIAKSTPLIVEIKYTCKVKLNDGQDAKYKVNNNGIWNYCDPTVGLLSGQSITTDYSNNLEPIYTPQGNGAAASTCLWVLRPANLLYSPSLQFERYNANDPWTISEDTPYKEAGIAIKKIKAGSNPCFSKGLCHKIALKSSVNNNLRVNNTTTKVYIGRSDENAINYGYILSRTNNNLYLTSLETNGETFSDKISVKLCNKCPDRILVYLVGGGGSGGSYTIYTEANVCAEVRGGAGGGPGAAAAIALDTTKTWAILLGAGGGELNSTTVTGDGYASGIFAGVTMPNIGDIVDTWAAENIINAPCICVGGGKTPSYGSTTGGYTGAIYYDNSTDFALISNTLNWTENGGSYGTQAHNNGYPGKGCKNKLCSTRTPAGASPNQIFTINTDGGDGGVGGTLASNYSGHPVYACGAGGGAGSYCEENGGRGGDVILVGITAGTDADGAEGGDGAGGGGQGVRISSPQSSLSHRFPGNIGPGGDGIAYIYIPIMPNVTFSPITEF